MRRREFITLIGGAVVSTLWPLRARSADKVYRIVFVVPIGQFADANKVLVTAFLQGLRELGYVDGKNMKFEFYSAEGRFGEIDEIAARVLETSPDAILAAGGGANEVAHAFQRLTRTVPIVMANSSDPVMQGLVADLASPGGNITGFTGNTGPEFEAKRLQLLREVAPNATRVAYLGLKLDWESPAAIGVRNAAERLGMTLLHAEHTPSNYNDAFGLHSPGAIAGAVRRAESLEFLQPAGHHRICNGSTDGGGVPNAGVCRGHRPDLLRAKSFRPLSACRGPCRQDPERR